jgi:hypothetical protein
MMLMMMMMMMLVVVDTMRMLTIVINKALIQAYKSLLSALKFVLKKYRSISVDLRSHGQSCLIWRLSVHRHSRHLFEILGTVPGGQKFQFLFAEIFFFVIFLPTPSCFLGIKRWFSHNEKRENFFLPKKKDM